jgi:TatD DNase family protein
VRPPTRSPIIDTHAHLDEPVFDPDRDEVLDRARASGVRRFINIAYSPERWTSSRLLRDRHPDIEIAIGVHPMLASEFDSELAGRLAATVTDCRPVAIGETGFDFSRPLPTPDQQTRAFRAQLEMAVTERLPVVIHQRGAAEALMTELDRWPEMERIVLHSFDATPRLADWAVERGCFVGIGGLATRRSASELRLLLARIPTDRLLLETDAPYLPPPGAGSRRNEPANLPRIVELLAPLWNLDHHELCRITAATATALFALQPLAPSVRRDALTARAT